MFTDQTELGTDLNARHVSWHNRRSNKNGNTVHCYAETENIAVISTDTPTLFPANKSTPSVIDLITSV